MDASVQRRRREARAAGSHSWLAGPVTGLAVLLSVLATQSGCRLFSRNASAERLIASRRMSLQGTDALQRGHWEEAESLFGSAVKQCAVDERARAGYAEALWQRGACDEAIRQMEQATRLAEGDQDLLVRLGEMRLAHGDRDGAAACAQQALTRQRQSAAAWALQGDVLRGQGKLDEALQSYYRALHCDGCQHDVQVSVAEIYCQQDRPRRALSALEAVAEACGPGRVPSRVLVMQGIAQRRLGRYEEAVASFTAATRNGPATAEVLKLLSESQLAAGDTAAAQQTVQEALRLAPNDPNLQQLLASLESGQPRMAALNRDSTTN